jgi:short-subunit dehydrogenase
MNAVPRQLAVITGASTGIGIELARLCAQQKFDLIIAADEPLIANAARELSLLDGNCTPVECDLASAEGVEKLASAIAAAARPVDALFANAGRGLGRSSPLFAEFLANGAPTFAAKWAAFRAHPLLVRRAAGDCAAA